MTRIVTVVFLGMLAAFAAFDIWLWSARMGGPTRRETHPGHSPSTAGTGAAGGDAGYAHREVLAGRQRKDLMRLRPAPPKNTPPPATPETPAHVTVKAVLVEAHHEDQALAAILPAEGSPFIRGIPASRLATLLEPLEGESGSKVIAEPQVETLLDAPTRIVLDLGDEMVDSAVGMETAAGLPDSPPPGGSLPGGAGYAASSIALDFTVSRTEAGTLIIDLHPRLTGASCPGVSGAREIRTKVALGRNESVLLGGLVWCAPAAASPASRRRELMMILTPHLGGE